MRFHCLLVEIIIVFSHIIDSFGLYCTFPTDVLSAGVALGHAGEWDALRDYLKSSYKASQLGQVSHFSLS